MTFDWAQIAYIGSPLLTPWWAAANVVGGLVIVIWILAPILCKISIIDHRTPTTNISQITETRCSLRSCLSSRLQYSTILASRTTSAGSSQRTTTSITRPILNTARFIYPSLMSCLTAFNLQVSRRWSPTLYAGMVKMSGSSPRNPSQKALEKGNTSISL